MNNLEYAREIFFEVYDEMVEILGDMPDLFDFEGIVINTRLSRAIARCIQRPMTYGPPTYRFDVSPLFFKLDYEVQRNIAAHEWIHAICGLGEHHGSQFKYYMHILNSRGFHIVVSDTFENFGLTVEHRDPKYILRCTKCGHQFTRDRMCDVVRYSARYQHTGCGGSLQRIK